MSLRCVAVCCALLTLDSVAAAQSARPRIVLLNGTGRIGPDSVGATAIVAAQQPTSSGSGFFLSVIKARRAAVRSDLVRVDVVPRASATVFSNLPLDYFGMQTVAGSLDAVLIASTIGTAGASTSLAALTGAPMLYPQLGATPMNIPTFACDLGGECLMATSLAPSAGMVVQRFVPGVLNTIASAPIETVNLTAMPEPTSFDADFLSSSAIVVWSSVVSGASRVFGQWLRPRPSNLAAAPIVLGFGRAPRVACLRTFGVCLIGFVRDSGVFAVHATRVNDSGEATPMLSSLPPSQKLLSIDLAPITNGFRVAALVQYSSNANALAAVDFIGSMGTFTSSDSAVMLPAGEPSDLRLATRPGEDLSLATWVGEGSSAVASGALIFPTPFADGGADSGADASRDAEAPSDAGADATIGPSPDASDAAVIEDVARDGSQPAADSATAPQTLYTGGACNCRAGFVRPSSAQFAVVALVTALSVARRSRRRRGRVALDHHSNPAWTTAAHDDHRQR